MAKIKLQHFAPVDGKPYALLPLGLKCNKALLDAEYGDIIEFWTDWRCVKMSLVRKCRLKIKTSAFPFMVQSLYGEAVTPRMILDRWKTECIREGYGKNGFSQDECLMIEVEPIEQV